MERVPEDRDARLAFLEGWAKGQRSRLAEEQRRLAEDERRRGYAQELARVAAQAGQADGQANPLQGAGAIPVVITKPTELPGARAAVLADLLAGLRAYGWADPIVSECDRPKYTAPRAIDLARRRRPDAPWVLYMEDDVILGPDFGLLPELLREAGERFPRSGIVSFFSGVFVEPGWSVLPLEKFGWLQCVAIRNTGRLAGLRSFIDQLAPGADMPSSGPETGEAQARQRRRPTPPSDKALATFMAAEFDTFALWCPSLVQHAELDSVFGGEQLKRISRSYELAYRASA